MSFRLRIWGLGFWIYELRYIESLFQVSLADSCCFCGVGLGQDLARIFRRHHEVPCPVLGVK